jgi:hypothetical protein
MLPTLAPSSVPAMLRPTFVRLRPIQKEGVRLIPLRSFPHHHLTIPRILPFLPHSAPFKDLAGFKPLDCS